jgi:hypothetical protein
VRDRGTVLQCAGAISRDRSRRSATVVGRCADPDGSSRRTGPSPPLRTGTDIVPLTYPAELHLALGTLVPNRLIFADDRRVPALIHRPLG